LAYRRAHLPEHAEIEKLHADLVRLRDLQVAAQTAESDAAREQTKAEQDVDQVRTRSVRDQQRLDSGAVSSPKDLENLQREITSLARRQSDLEDVVLEVMERREAAQERAVELMRQRDAAQVALAETEQGRDTACAEIDGDLFKLYTRLREQSAGIGAARLYQRRCEGCRLELNITEINDIRAAAEDTVIRCENCRRILVRTSESGL
jgi:predicted  nucleic acid-binding Zn-ribbon protein